MIFEINNLNSITENEYIYIYIIFMQELYIYIKNYKNAYNQGKENVS